MGKRKPATKNEKAESPPAPTRPGLTLKKKLMFSLFVLVFVFGAVELALRASGFNMETRVERMEFSFPVDDYNKSAPQRYLQRDEELFWKPIAGALGHNSKGLYGPEFGAKPSGVYRIVCLGDSCTHFGPMSYPDILRAYLDEQAPGQFEVINAACIGYTSFQGRTVLEKRALQWEPDLVTAYFGWNDHWLAKGLADKEQNSATTLPGDSFLSGIRLIQALRLMKSQTASRPANLMRVGLDDYRDNLDAIGERCAEKKVEAWYLTAPHALDLGIPPYLHTSGEISNPDGLIPLHQRYNAAVRRVASERKATLIDLESEMDKMNKNDLFIEDHIHLSDAGKIYVVKRLFETLKERGIFQPKVQPRE